MNLNVDVGWSRPVVTGLICSRDNRLDLAKLLMLVLAESYSCKTEQKTDQGSAARSWVNRTPDTMLTLPVTKEIVDTDTNIAWIKQPAIRSRVYNPMPINAANVARQRLNNLDFMDRARKIQALQHSKSPR
jgi:hypothetical protein